MKYWVFNPNSGGKTIPLSIKIEVQNRLEKYAALKYKGNYNKLSIKFHGSLCYMDAYQEPKKPNRKLLEITRESIDVYLERQRQIPIHLGRMRYFGDNRWSYAFYTYSNERYEPTTFKNGDWFGSPEEAFDIGAMYL
jgi:hypothetical protein